MDVLAALPDAKGGIAAWVLGLGAGQRRVRAGGWRRKSLPAGTVSAG